MPSYESEVLQLFQTNARIWEEYLEGVQDYYYKDCKDYNGCSLSTATSDVVQVDLCADDNTRYRLSGARDHEIIVIGTHIDPAIMPGFTYRVRNLAPVEKPENDSDDFVFDGRPMQLEAIGCGYGKRLTFSKDRKQKNYEANYNYFYSDTNSHGYGFTICPVLKGDKFTIYGTEMAPMGHVCVTSIDFPQYEINSQCYRDVGIVEKQVRVTFQCVVTLNGDHHGILDLVRIDHEVIVTGIIQMQRSKRAKAPRLSDIYDVQIQGLPGCKCYLVKN